LGDFAPRGTEFRYGLAKVSATIPQAAAEMGVPVAQIRAWLRNGAPVARPGQRGRGHAALVDVAALQTWLRSREPLEESHRAIARDLVGDMAAIVVARWRARSDPQKLRDAGVVVAEFATLADAVHERLGLPALSSDEWPLEIKQMCSALNNFRELR
jgi:phage terminase Nu1 subunit (DNA packaging protein)